MCCYVLSLLCGVYVACGVATVAADCDCVGGAADIVAVG